MISTLTDIATLIKTIIDIKKEVKQKEEKKAIDKVIATVKDMKSKLITRQDVLNIIRQNPTSSMLLPYMFDNFLTHEDANKFIQKKVAKNEKIGSREAIDPKLIHFEAHHLTFSSFGTPGYVLNLSDGSVVVFHAGNEDEGRLFAVQWGIGYYYKTFLGVSSFLGFPVSNEHSTDSSLGRKGSKNDFEGGYIEYIPEYEQLKIHRNGIRGSRLVAIHIF